LRGFSLNFRPLTKPLANVHECNASSPKTAIGPDRNRGKKGQRLHQLFAYPDWGRIQTELTLFQSRSLRKLNVRDASFKEDAEANLNKRLDKIMRPKRSSPDSRRTGVQCFGSRCAGSFLRYGCARRQLSHRFVGFEGRDEMCVEELGAMVGMPVASSARAMAPRIEPPLRATALISRVPGGGMPGLSAHSRGCPRSHTCGAALGHRWHRVVSALQSFPAAVRSPKHDARGVLKACFHQTWLHWPGGRW
jgi:hypothetical protein